MNVPTGLPPPAPREGGPFVLRTFPLEFSVSLAVETLPRVSTFGLYGVAYGAVGSHGDHV